MAYKLDSVSLRMNNSEEEMNKLAQLWTDVQTGKLPLMFDSDGKFAEGLSPISIYSNYEDDINGAYDLTIMTVGPEFFQMLEQEAAKGVFKKYDAASDSDDFTACATDAWQQVLNDQQNGTIQRLFAEDIESTVPAAYTKDGKTHCYLYISVEEQG